MKSTVRIRRLAGTTGVALVAVVALAAGAAANAVGPSEHRASTVHGNALECRHARAQECMSYAEFRALMIRSDALNRMYGLGRYREGSRDRSH